MFKNRRVTAMIEYDICKNVLQRAGYALYRQFLYIYIYIYDFFQINNNNLEIKTHVYTIHSPTSRSYVSIRAAVCMF
jgi:hypothetical protein